MNAKTMLCAALLCALVPATAGIDRGGGGAARPAGGFDFHNDAAASRPQTYSRSSTGPAGTNRSTTINGTGNGYNRTTTATNGGYSRTSTGAANANGSYSHTSSGSSPYGSHASGTAGNYNTGNYAHAGGGSNQYGSYGTAGAGNAYNHTYSGSASATNWYGQTYHSSTYVNNGTVYHGAVVTNPVYAGPAWGWNGGIAWYPAPYYWGGGFWGSFAIGAAMAATSAVVYGSIVNSNITYTSYQVQPSSPGAKLLQSYQLTQVPCGPPNLVVIYGPSNSVICATPNQLVAAGNYSLDSSTLTLASEKAG